MANVSAQLNKYAKKQIASPSMIPENGRVSKDDACGATITRKVACNHGKAELT